MTTLQTKRASLTVSTGRLAVVPSQREVGPDVVHVTLVADDPVSRAGMVAQLADAAGVFLLEAHESTQGCDVAMVTSHALGDFLCAQVARLRLEGVTRVLACVSAIDEAGLLSAVEAGVCGVIRRSEATTERLTEAIRAAAGGDGSLPPDLLGLLLDHVQKLTSGLLLSRGLRLSGLTERETDVLRLVAEGYDTKEIAEQLCFCERTVKNILHDLTTRLQLRNRAHAVAFAIRQGLI